MDLESVVQDQGIGFLSHDYPLLESYLGMALVDRRHLASLTRTLRQTKSLPAGLPGTCCIVFEVDQNSNAAVRVLTLAFHLLSVRRARRNLAHLTGHPTDLIGVYPKLDNPTVIFELDSPAANYVHANVLPAFGNSLASRVKRLMFNVFKTDPGLAGIGVVVRFR